MCVAGGFAAGLRVNDFLIDRCAFEYECSDGARSIGGSQRILVANVLARAQDERASRLLGNISLIR